MRQITATLLVKIIAILMLIYVAVSCVNSVQPGSTKPTVQTYEQIPVEEPWLYTYELELLASAIFYEAGSDECTDRHQQLVGQVIINRCNSNEFPNTIYDVITQKGQYGPCDKIVANAGNRDIIPQRCYDNALAVLNGEVECPDNIVWQANFIQGSGIYEKYKTSYSTTYFCYR